jgi:hypothetical protein
VAVYCGIDWAEGHHDIALVDDDGKLIAKRRINESLGGLAELTAMLAGAGDRVEEPIPVAIETPRGLLVAVLRATGRPVYPINPLAVARYRERTSMSGKKSDHVDAMALANILRTDQHLHRTLPDDSALARSITVLARAYQDAVWRRTKLVQELRDRLREYYPGFLAASASGSRGGLSTTRLASADARQVLAIAPSPADGLTVSKARVETALRRGGRQRRISSLAACIVTALRVRQLRQDPMVEQAMRTETLALLGVLNAVCDSVDRLAAALVEAFAQTPGLRDHHQLSRPGRHQRRHRARRGRRRPHPLRRRPRVAGLRRIGTGHPGLGQVAHRDPAPDQEQPARRDRPLLGLQRRRPALPGTRALPASPRPRRRTSRRAAPPVQPHARPAAPLPANGPDLRPDQGLPACHIDTR